jgi:putative SOS response-associated peptidase YedK
MVGEITERMLHYRDAWRHGQRCVIPVEAFFEPDWRSGKSVATRIARANGQPMGIAGLWSWWKSPKGELIYSFTILTINADLHPLMNQFHKPTDEKRMVALLPEHRYQEWLEPDANVQSIMVPFPADELQAVVPSSSHGLFA